VRSFLYISQIGERSHPRRGIAPDERQSIPPVFRQLDAQVTVVDATEQPLPQPHHFSGVVVGGSLGSVHDQEPWRGVLARWLTSLGTTPFLGVCGGHQLYAHINGAEVVTMPSRRFGVFPLDLDGIQSFAGAVIQMHGEVVRTPPANASIWAEDASGIQALRYAPGVWSVQFHPELTVEVAARTAEICKGDPARWAQRDVERAVATGRALLAAWIAEATSIRSGSPDASI
jgi:GMP synthase (glutamine-hydrolysing)